MPGEPLPGGARSWRDDDRAHRVIVRGGPGERRGLRRASRRSTHAAFDATVARLAAAGFDVTDGSDADRARAAGRAGSLARPRRGASTSRSSRGLANAATPFASPLVPGGFLTDGVGFGHVVFATTDVRRVAPRSSSTASGSRSPTGSRWSSRRASSSRSASTTATSATTPSRSRRRRSSCPRRLHHVMFETNERDDVGAAFDRAWATDLAIPNGLGRHDNDGMFSFYVAEPGRLPGRGRARRTRHHRRLGRRPPLRPHQRVGPPAAALGMTATASTTDVAIVGGGTRRADARRSCSPSAGDASSVLERWPEPYPLPRAVHFDHEVGRILQSCGIGPELRAISEPAEIYEWRNARGHHAAPVRSASAPAPSGWPESSMFCQPELEALLEERAGALPTLEIRRGVEVSALEQHDDHVRGARRPRAHRSDRAVRGRLRRREQHRARARSASTSYDLGFFYDWLIVDVVLDEPRVFDPLNLQICDPARPTTAVSGGPGRRRWEFMRLPRRDARRAERRSTRVGAARAVGRQPRQRARSNATRSTRSRRAYAEQLAGGPRASLAGDAAHQMPPFAGQGMCAGIRDAANLAWKLDLVLDGRAAGRAARHLRQERLPSARQAIDFSMELGKVICVPDPEEAAARDEAMAAVGHRRARRGARAARASTPACVRRRRHPHAGRAVRAGHRRRPRRSTTCTAPAGGSSPSTPDAARSTPALRRWFASIGGVVVDRRRRRRRTAAGSPRTGATAVLAASRLPPVRHRHRSAPAPIDLARTTCADHLRPCPRHLRRSAP